MDETERLKKLIFELETHELWPWPIMITEGESLLLPEVEQKERKIYLETLHRAFTSILERNRMNWEGKYFKGAKRQIKAEKRKEAEARNAKTAPERRRSYRRENPT